MKRSLFSLTIAAALTLPTAAVHAAFYVDDDAPTLTAANPFPIAAPAPVSRAQEVAFDVTFVPTHSWLNPEGFKALRTYVEELKATEQIRITTYRTLSNNAAIQKIRGQNIKQWMTNAGIPAEKISVVADQGFAPMDPSGNTATITIVQANITPPSPSPSPRYLAAMSATPVAAAIQPVYAAPMRPVELSKQAATIDDKVKLALIHRIVSMSQNKVVDPEDAMHMLAEILKLNDLSPAAGTAQPVTTQTVAVEFPRAWTLDSQKTLKQNVEEWAKLANWTVPTWQSTTQFKIENAPTMNGTFIDVLGQLATAIPSLDFKANKKDRSLTVMDSRK